VDHHGRTIYSELERPPVIARQSGIGHPHLRVVGEEALDGSTYGATDEFREGTESAETKGSGAAALSRRT
jgi:hypothetical protein